MTIARRRFSYLGLVSVLMILGVILLAAFYSGEISEGVLNGLILAITKVIPTTLPFMIISDLFLSFVRVEEIPFLPTAFEGIFSVSKAALGAVVIGSICGFPLGARMIAELYRMGALKKDEAERAIAYSSMPSAPFIIGVVGKGMLGDTRLGIILFISLHIGNILSAQFFRKKVYKTDNPDNIMRQSFSFVESVKSAGIGAIYVTAFISIFNLFSDTVKRMVTNKLIKWSLISVLELAGASDYFTDILPHSSPYLIGILAFSAGFGGISVLSQTSAFTSPSGLSIKPYLSIKILSAILSTVVAVLLLFFLG